MRVVVAVLVALGMPALQPDPARVIADMRQALGGDAALAAVRSFSVEVSESLKLDGVSVNLSTEWSAVLPDSVVRVRRNPPGLGHRRHDRRL